MEKRNNYTTTPATTYYFTFPFLPLVGAGSSSTLVDDFECLEEEGVRSSSTLEGEDDLPCLEEEEEVVVVVLECLEGVESSARGVSTFFLDLELLGAGEGESSLEDEEEEEEEEECLEGAGAGFFLSSPPAGVSSSSEGRGSISSGTEAGALGGEGEGWKGDQGTGLLV